MKKHLSTLVFVLIFIIGLSLLLYPTVSDYVNKKNQTRAMASYTETISQIAPEDYTAFFEQAQAYNQALQKKLNRFYMTDEERLEYNTLLNPADSQIMGFLQIDAIGVSLPIYHGTDEAVLQVGIGHLEGSSLPSGEKGSHVVLSGHRGLPSAKLLSNLDQVVEGDVFLVTVLDQVFAYQVDQILIVEPAEVEPLAIDPENEYCTLVTCTPYGVNSHRMLVRGHRVDYEATKQNSVLFVKADATKVAPMRIVPFLAVPILLALVVIVVVQNPSKKKGKK